VDIAEAPSNSPGLEAALFRRLLELNATDLVFVAFGIDRGRIVIDAALELGTMDIRELEAVLGNIDMVIAEHVPQLRGLVRKG
jgi:hypothetical protein